MPDNSLIKNLQNPQAYQHPVTSFKLLDTHISWVILTGEFAYKIKKPVDFGFLDFSTLEKRRFYCTEEIRLNQQLASEIYLEVVTINGDPASPKINGDGPILEYAVKMREFPQENLFTALLEQNKLTPELIAQLAKLIAEFHQRTPIAPMDAILGSPAHVHAPVLQNFEQILPFLMEDKDRKQLSLLQQWSEQQFQHHQQLFSARKTLGFIRECHGDLHLKNIVLYQGKPELFDRIEFNDDLLWTDVIADMAFLAMDLADHQQTTLAQHFINQYFIHTGDYAGLALLPYYFVYRAIVRAKIALFSLAQSDAATQQQLWQSYRSFMQLAENYTQVRTPTLFITHGLSGSGKSSVANLLAMQMGALQIRSDIERKRLFNLPAAAKTQSELNQGIYDPTVTEKIYLHLAQLAKTIIAAGYSVIVDATFLKTNQRKQFQELANKLNADFKILSCQAPHEQLEIWLKERETREHEPSEAGLAVLQLQTQALEPLTDAEQPFTLVINTAAPDAEETLKNIFKGHC